MVMLGLFQRAKQFEQTSFKGLFNFINFINKLRNSSGDMGSAKILGENEDVVRIMSIHKSKGLEFPVVFTCGFGKQFNLMDLNKSILYHDDLGLGPDYVDLERRNSYSTLAKEAIKKKILFETLSEEMRILYVAFTRAKEKLIITGATRNLEKSISRWVSSAALDDEIVPASEVLKGKSYLDWIGMAICKHRDGEELRKYIGANNSSIINDFSTWRTQMWTKNLLAVEKNEVAVDENEETDLFINSDVDHIDKEIERRLNYKYKYDLAGKLPSNVSVSDLKRSLYNNENDDVITVNIFSDKEVLKPKFLQEKRGLSASERGTIAHFIMQKLDLNKVNTKEEIDTQLYSMKDKNLLTEEEIKDNILKELKMSGLLLKDINVVKAMDNDMDSYSLIIPAAIKKDGNFTSSSSVITEEQFDTLRKYVNDKMSEICEEMLSGEIKIEPCKNNNTAYCSYCDYSSVCQFDTSIENNKYRVVLKKSNDEAWKLIKDEVEKGGNN